MVNLASRVHLVRDEEVLATWTVDARGRSDLIGVPRPQLGLRLQPW